jgi:DNA-binding transcriptional regulator YiaG
MNQTIASLRTNVLYKKNKLFYKNRMVEESLRNSLNLLGISAVEFARLINVTPRAVHLWLNEDRELSGPAIAYLRLFQSLPRAMQVKEIARIRQEDPMGNEGMYSFQFAGAQGAGVGALVLNNGRAFGSDGGVLYDGTYEPNRSRPGFVDVKLHLTVPPGTALVQGVPPQPMTFGFDLACTFSTRGQTDVSVATPYGHVQGRVSFLRDVPST